MCKVINLSDYKKGNVNIREPLFPKTIDEADFAVRMQRINTSLTRINNLMEELRKHKEKQ